MTKEERRLAEDTYVALVLILGKLIVKEAAKKGTTRVGGDFTPEAMRLIAKERSRILSLVA